MTAQNAYPVMVATLAAQIPAAVNLTAEDIAYYEGCIPAADALEAGANIESVSVLDEVLRLGDLCAPAVLGGKVSGYGPLRLRYCLTLAASLAEKVTALDTSRVSATGAGKAQAVSLRASRDLRTRAIRVLRSLAGRREEEKARLSKARRGAEKPDERARSLEVLADELKEAMKKVPATVAKDAGATQELVEALQQAAGVVLGSRGDAQQSRGAVMSLYDEMNLLDGRLLHEIRELVGAVRDTRKVDKGVPAVKSSLLRSGIRGKKKGEEAAPS